MIQDADQLTKILTLRIDALILHKKDLKKKLVEEIQKISDKLNNTKSNMETMKKTMSKRISRFLALKQEFNDTS